MLGGALRVLAFILGVLLFWLGIDPSYGQNIYPLVSNCMKSGGTWNYDHQFCHYRIDNHGSDSREQSSGSYGKVYIGDDSRQPKLIASCVWEGGAWDVDLNSCDYTGAKQTEEAVSVCNSLGGTWNYTYEKCFFNDNPFCLIKRKTGKQSFCLDRIPEHISHYTSKAFNGTTYYLRGAVTAGISYLTAVRHYVIYGTIPIGELQIRFWMIILPLLLPLSYFLLKFSIRPLKTFWQFLRNKAAQIPKFTKFKLSGLSSLKKGFQLKTSHDRSNLIQETIIKLQPTLPNLHVQDPVFDIKPIKLIFRRSQTGNAGPTFTLHSIIDLPDGVRDAAKHYGVYKEIVYIDPKLEEARSLKAEQVGRQLAQSEARFSDIKAGNVSAEYMVDMSTNLVFDIIKWTILLPFYVIYRIYIFLTSERKQIIRFSHLVEGKSLTSKNLVEIIEAENQIKENMTRIANFIARAAHYTDEIILTFPEEEKK